MSATNQQQSKSSIRHSIQHSIQKHINVTAAVSGVELLKQQTGLPKSRIKDAMTKGAVWIMREGVSTRLRRGSAVVQPGQRLSIYYNPQILQMQPPNPVLVRDESVYSVWDKPVGLMSSGTRFGDHHSMARQVQLHLDRPTYLVHRLDRFTQGVMVLAHNKATAAKLSRQFAQRIPCKAYRARVWGILDKPLTIQQPLDGKSAVTHVEPVMPGPTSLVDVQIETGRKHQIRRHLAGAGFPIVGDRLYGRGETDQDMCLAAVSLAFVCPVQGKLIQFRSSEQGAF